MSPHVTRHSSPFLYLSLLFPIVFVRGEDCERDELLIDDPALAAFLQQRLEAEAGHFPGTALAISLSGVGTWKGARGFSDLEQRIPMQPDDRVRIASITKPFVGAVVLQLDQEGVLDLEDAMEAWVPGYFDGQGVKLRHLLSHTSGVPNYDAHFGRPDARTAEEILAYVAQSPLLFPPGTQSSYSNTNFVILGMAIEAASGAPWHAEVRRRLLDPLGLDDTYVAGVESLPGGRVRGYDRDGSGRFIDVTETTDPRHCGAAGDMVSNTRDLLRWMEALIGGEVLDARHLELMTTNFSGTVVSQTSPLIGVYLGGYGLGLAIEDDIGTGTGFGHPGGMGGAEAFLLYYPDERMGLAIVANSLAYPSGNSAGDIAIAAAIAARDFCAGNGCAVKDRDRNGVADACEIESGEAQDCNRNGVPDAAELSPAELRFAPAQELGMGGSPTSLVAADLDRDGDLDLVTGNVAENGISILVNQGGAVFAAPVEYALEHQPIAIEPADLDGDGAPDMAILLRTTFGFRSKKLALLLHQGNAHYGAAIQRDLEREVTALAGADLDGDGDLDLALVAATEGEVYTLSNDGNGSFEPAAGLHLGRLPGAIAAADFNADGRVDAAVSHPRETQVSISLGDGRGSFSAPAFTSSGGSAAFLAAGDLDGDEDLDLVAGNAAQYSLSLLLNSGAGEFVTAGTLSAGLDPPSPLVLADLDGDVDLDIGSPAGERVLIRRNAGNALFPPALLAGAAAGRPMRSILAGDWDADGRADLAGISTSPGAVSLLMNRTAVPVGDCNDNGVPDACDIESEGVDDANGNGVPDGCELRPSFHRGDPNQSGEIDISDAVFVFAFLFIGGPTPTCLESADTNNSGVVDISDGIFTLDWLFIGSSTPADPGPPTTPCGMDPDPADSPGDLGCEKYLPCE